MYKVKITDLNKKIRNTKIYDFIGELNEEVRQRWARIAKHAPSMKFEILDYSFKEGKNEN